MTRPTKQEQFTAWTLVAIQAVLIVAVVIIPRDPAWDETIVVTVAAQALIIGALLLGVWGAVHLGRGLTPSPLPNGAIELVTNGAYRWMRHPIYAAVMTGVAGIALRTRTVVVISLAVVLIVFLNLKARWEETRLERTFPGYAAYMTRTARFLPLRFRD